MVIYSILKMIHGGIIHHDQRYENLLLQNKYYVIPTINVDTLYHIEENYRKSGVILKKRKNMH